MRLRLNLQSQQQQLKPANTVLQSPVTNPSKDNSATAQQSSSNGGGTSGQTNLSYQQMLKKEGHQFNNTFQFSAHKSSTNATATAMPQEQMKLVVQQVT